MSFVVKYNSVPVTDGPGFNTYWSQDEWIVWFYEMTKRYGRNHAKWKFEQTWTQSEAHRSGTFYNNFNKINAFFDKEKINVERPSSIVTSASNLLSFAKKIPTIAVNTVAGGAALYGLYRVATLNSDKARTTAEKVRLQAPGVIFTALGVGGLLWWNLGGMKHTAKSSGSKNGSMFGNVPYNLTYKFYLGVDKLLSSFPIASQLVAITTYGNILKEYQKQFPQAYAKLLREGNGSVNLDQFIAEVADIRSHWAIEWMDSAAYASAQASIEKILKEKTGIPTWVSSSVFAGVPVIGPIYSVYKLLK